MILLEYREAIHLINEAHALHREHQSLRFGQALFNTVPSEVASQFTGTEKDFFHNDNCSEVMQIYMDYWVDTSTIS